MEPKKIAVLISGSGTNLQSIIDGCNSGEINGVVRLVVSNKPDAYGLKRAEKNGINIKVVDSNVFDKKEFDEILYSILVEGRFDLIVLAGYLKKVDEKLVQAFRNRIINIHPSLIPSFCGEGYYGERVHRAVYDAGVKITGATVHFVDESMDTGPIIIQEPVKVLDSYGVEDIKNAVLEVEHRILVKAVKGFCDGSIYFEDGRVKGVNS